MCPAGRVRCSRGGHFVTFVLVGVGAGCKGPPRWSELAGIVKRWG
jgi:hypothetical protein